MIEALRRLKNMILSSIGKSLLLAVNDTTGLQTIKISMLKNEVNSNVERVQNYGLTSNPPKNSEAVYLAIGGNKDDVLAIAVDSAKYRLKSLENGEVALYSMFNNSHVLLKNDGSININSEKVNIGLSDLEKSVLGESIKTYLDSFFDEVFGLWKPGAIQPPVPNSGSIALKTLYTAWSTAHSLDNYLSNNIKNG